MAKEVIDIYIEQGYPYDFTIDLNDILGNDLENKNDLFFYCKSIGEKQFTVYNNVYSLTLTSVDTAKLSKTLEQYSVYAISTETETNGEKSKMLSGRIHLDKKVII